jgi:hypothetical protein
MSVFPLLILIFFQLDIVENRNDSLINNYDDESVSYAKQRFDDRESVDDEDDKTVDKGI